MKKLTKSQNKKPVKAKEIPVKPVDEDMEEIESYIRQKKLQNMVLKKATIINIQPQKNK